MAGSDFYNALGGLGNSGGLGTYLYGNQYTQYLGAYLQQSGVANPTAEPAKPAPEDEFGWLRRRVTEVCWS